jgi:hypothetical protein
MPDGKAHELPSAGNSVLSSAGEMKN